jgi:hypothetical protein
VTPPLQLVIEIAPRGVHRFNQFKLPAPRPALDRFLALDGAHDILADLVVDQPVNVVSLCEAAGKLAFVLRNTLSKVVRNPVYKTVPALLDRMYT